MNAVGGLSLSYGLFISACQNNQPIVLQIEMNANGRKKLHDSFSLDFLIIMS